MLGIEADENKTLRVGTSNIGRFFFKVEGNKSAPILPNFYYRTNLCPFLCKNSRFFHLSGSKLGLICGFFSLGGPSPHLDIVIQQLAITSGSKEFF